MLARATRLHVGTKVLHEGGHYSYYLPRAESSKLDTERKHKPNRQTLISIAPSNTEVVQAHSHIKTYIQLHIHQLNYIFGRFTDSNIWPILYINILLERHFSIAHVIPTSTLNMYCTIKDDTDSALNTKQIHPCIG